MSCLRSTVLTPLTTVMPTILPADFWIAFGILCFLLNTVCLKSMPYFLGIVLPTAAH